MGYSANNIDNGALYFGTVNPTVTGQEVDNDSFIVTSDGTPTGTPVSFWKFDEDTLTWLQVPSGDLNNDRVLYLGNNTVPTLAPPKGVDTAVLLNGNRYDWNGTVWILIPTPTVPVASTIVPIPDNDIDTAIRVGLIGTSLQYARADHNHPIRRQLAIATAPVLVIGRATVFAGSSTMVFRRSDGEGVEYSAFVGLELTATTAGWRTINVPNVAGFQTPNIKSIGTYRISGNPTGLPTAPFMGSEFHTAYGGGAISYWATSSAIPATRVYVSIVVKYTRL